jgi:hypothetical protein
MRIIIGALLLSALVASSARAQQPAASQAAPDLTRAAYVSAADLAAMVAKQPGDRNGTISRLLQVPGYSVNIEHRVPVAQAASVHETEAELFYIIDGAATLVTGGKLIEPTRNGANLSSTKGVCGRRRIAEARQGRLRDGAGRCPALVHRHPGLDYADGSASADAEPVNLVIWSFSHLVSADTERIR